MIDELYNLSIMGWFIGLIGGTFLMVNKYILTGSLYLMSIIILMMIIEEVYIRKFVSHAKGEYNE